MNPWLGWSIALGLVVAGWLSQGWHGVALAITLIAFAVLLQFNRVLRVMKAAAASPIGQVPSAVMLQAQLKIGQPMLKIVAQTKSLGRRAEGSDETYTWTDSGGDAITIGFVNGRCTHWLLTRSEADSAAHSVTA